jgi:hypothetical protein
MLAKSERRKLGGRDAMLLGFNSNSKAEGKSDRPVATDKDKISR